MSWITITCCRCKEPFGMHPQTYDVLQRSSQTFHCPFGHPQHFTPGKTEAEKLRNELDQERRRRQSAEQNIAYYQDEAATAKRKAATAKGQVTRIKRRTAAGVCTCCNRTFTNLARHMATKHPEEKHVH